MEEKTANSPKIPVSELNPSNLKLRIANKRQPKDPNDSKQLESEEMVYPPKISGSCACGSVKWSSTPPPSRGSFCYCKTCRKLSGGAFLAFMDFPSSSITFLPSSPSP